MPHFAGHDTDDALAELRAVLGQFGLSELADLAFELQLDGIYDPNQILSELEFHPVFQARFAGIRDADSGELLMTPAEYVEFDRSVQAGLTSFGLSHLYSRELIAGLVQGRRSIGEIQEDLRVYDEFRNNPMLRADFFAITGVDPGPEGFFALTLGLAPDLEQAYQRALDAGVSAQEFVQRRLAFEAQIAERETQMADIEGQADFTRSQIAELEPILENLTQQVNDINTQLAQRDASGHFVVRGDARQTLWQQRSQLIAQRTSYLTQRTSLNQALGGLTTQIDTLSTQRANLQTQLTDLINQAPDLTPDFAAGDPTFARVEVMRAFERARRVEQARFRAGGQTAGLDVQPLRRRRTF